MVLLVRGEVMDVFTPYGGLALGGSRQLVF